MNHLQARKSKPTIQADMIKHNPKIDRDQSKYFVKHFIDVRQCDRFCGLIYETYLTSILSLNTDNLMRIELTTQL